MRTTIKHIAEIAGVTHGVVSSVLNGTKGKIRAGEETAERIRNLAKEHGYRPSAYARSFRSSETKTIGVIHGDGIVRYKFNSSTRYFSSLMDGIVDGAFENGYTVSLCPRLLGGGSSSALADGRFDGYIWYSTNPNEDAERAIRECPYPIVLIHSPASSFDNKLPTVICDNAGGITMALEHLKSLGHKKVAFASNHVFEFLEAKLRREAFIKIGFDLDMETTTLSIANGCEAVVLDWLQNRDYTGLICHNEVLAGELMEIFQEKGISIPGDISIIGFDSTEYCDLQSPKLTSIAQPLEQIGVTAVKKLVDIMAGEHPPIETMLPCSFDVRGSTGPAKAD